MDDIIKSNRTKTVIVTYEQTVYDFHFFCLDKLSDNDRKDIATAMIDACVLIDLPPIVSKQRMICLIGDIGVAQLDFKNGSLFIHFKRDKETGDIFPIEPCEINNDMQKSIEEYVLRRYANEHIATNVLRMIFANDSFTLRNGPWKSIKNSTISASSSRMTTIRKVRSQSLIRSLPKRSTLYHSILPGR